MNIPNEWAFAFFDLGSKESARRVRLHRNQKKVGAAIHSQSVYCMPYSINGFKSLKDGQTVEYEEGTGEKGPIALNVTPK